MSPGTDDATDYDRITARDIADLLHHLADMRCAAATPSTDPADRAAFLTRKAELLTQIARDAERTRIDDYSRQARQIATDARAAAEQAREQLPKTQVGPDQRREAGSPPTTDGANSEENSGASSR
jgi:hypothetical protein